MNPFVLADQDYTRKMDLKGAAIRKTALFLHKSTNKPMADCMAYVEKNIQPDGKFPYKDPAVLFLERDPRTEDRARQTTTFSDYLRTILHTNRVLAPTLTSYLSVEEKRGRCGRYIVKNLALRKKHKKAMLDAKVAGKKALADFENSMQNLCKTKNNSLSGAHSSAFTPLYLRTGHSTLTSTCRITTSYGNTNNEKFIAGNRHYWAPHIAISDILTIVEAADYASIEIAAAQYGIRAPSIDETMECVKRSTMFYWSDENAFATIYRLIAGLTDVERMAFVYSGDFYHLAKYNDAAVRQFMGNMIQLTRETMALDEAKQIVKSLSGDEVALVACMCAEWTAGKNLDDMANPEKKEYDPVGYGIVASNAKMFRETLSANIALIHAFLRPPTLLTSIAKVPAMMRRAVIASDTDSTIFTNQHWVQWYCGGVSFQPDAYRVGYVMTFFATQMIWHLLAMMSMNIGFSREHLHLLQMKNEYYFPTFCLTPRAKHYWATKSAQEGKVFLEAEKEIKGVALRSSNAPPEINDALKDYMEVIEKEVMKNGNVSIHDILDPIAKTERDIYNSIMNGEPRFLRTVGLKDASSYVDGENASQLFHHKLWEEVFSTKYGPAPQLPYQAVKVNLELDNPTRLQAFLASMEDRVVADKLRDFLASKNRTNLGVMMFPRAIIQQIGIPQEVRGAVTFRKLIFEIMAPYYLVMEGLGLYMENKNHTRLVADTWKTKEERAAQTT